MELLATSQFYFIFSRVEMRRELNFSFNQIKKGRAVTSMD
jgi:hypothetical protein